MRAKRLNRTTSKEVQDSTSLAAMSFASFDLVLFHVSLPRSIDSLTFSVKVYR